MKRYLFGIIMAVALIASAPQKSEAYTTGTTGAYYTAMADFFAAPTSTSYSLLVLAYGAALSDSASSSYRHQMLVDFGSVVTAYTGLLFIPHYVVPPAPASPA